MKKTFYYFILLNSLLLPEILSQQITVLSPNGGENWHAGIETFITWSAPNISGRLSIDLIGGDVITNGDMELDANWIDVGVPTLNERSSEQAHNGTYSRKVVAGNVGWNGIQQSNITFTPDTVYRLSFWAYSVGGTQLRYAVWDGNNDMFGTAFADLGTGTWTKIIIDFTTSPTADNTGNVRFITNATVETFYIDDVMIQKITPIDPSTGNDGSKPWEIPFDLEEGTDYKVKIASVNDPTIFDFSDNNFTITANTITVTSPNGGESWHSPPDPLITWDDNWPQHVTGEKVKIQLFKSGTLYSLIKESTTSDGEYEWTIADNIPPGSDYKVIISSLNYSSVFDLSDNDFTIVGDEVTLTSPNGGENWFFDDPEPITWTSNFSDRVKIELWKGGILYYTVDPDAQNDGLRNWSPPSTLPEGSDYRIKITSLGDPDVFDYSDADFTLSYYITVTSPNGGESLQAGTTQTITWNDNIAGKVKIDLYKGGSFDSPIKDSTASDGTYNNWTIPFDFQEGSDYKVLITSLDDPTLFDDSNDNFTIFLVPEITVISPNGGEAWQTGTTQTITWADNLTEDLQIRLYSFPNFITLEESVPSSGSYTWEIPVDFPPNNFYYVYINSVSDPTIEDDSDATFSIETTAINITSPNGGEEWQAGTTHQIHWTDNISDSVKIDLYKDGVPHSSIKDGTASDGTYNWDIPYNIQGGSDYKVKITSLGNSDVFDFSDNNFNIEANQITITSPNGGENWQIGTTNTITWIDNFSDNVKIQLFKSDTFHSIIRSNTASDGSYTWTIEETIPPGSDYKVRISNFNNDNIFDFSDEDFTLSYNITVTYPNGGESLQAGTPQTITWTDNIVDDVKIDLYKGGTLHSPITASTPSGGTYNWLIPYEFEDDGSDYKVKITSLGDPNLFDYSDSNFTIIANQVTVTSPNGGENWPLGSTQTITWNDNFPENVRIKLFQGGNLAYTIDLSYPSNGERIWEIPASLPEGSDYRILISSIASNSIFDFSDADFTLSHNITVTSPNAGESWQAGTTQQIHWTDNIAGKVKIDLYKGGAFDSPIKDSTASDGTYNWNIPFDFQEGSDYKVLIISLNDPTLFDYSDDNFSIFLVHEITVVYPNGGQTWQTGTTQTITWADNLTEKVRIRLYSFATNFITVEDSVPSSGSYDWTIPLDFTPNNFYKVWINSVNDTTIEDDSDAEFSIETTAINITSPNGGESWQAGTSHQITSIDNFSDSVKIDLYKGGVFDSSIKDGTDSDGTYSWNIPYNIQGGSDYKVKMTSLGNPDVFDFSDNNFTIVANQITITSPNGGESWQIGSDQVITWDDNFSDNVQIQLFKSDTLYSTLRVSTASDGSWSWNNIAGTIPPGSDYKIKIFSLGGDSSIFDFSDNNFTLFAQDITVTSPNGGENWQIGTTDTIHWNDNISNNVKIQLFKSDTFYSTIKSNTASDGSYTWTIAETIQPGSDYKVRISSIGNDNIFDFSDANFTLSYNITVTSPNGGESWQAGITYQIHWTDNINDSVKIDLYKGGVFHSSIKDGTDSDGTYNWDIPFDFQEGSDYKVLITSLDDPDIFDFSDNNFIIVANQVTVTSPNGGENWLLDSEQTITWADNFSENVKIELYKGGILIYTVDPDAPSIGSYVWYILPSLPDGSDYKIKITSLGNANVVDFSDANFTLSYNITVTSPNGGESLQAGTTQQVHWTDNINEAVKIDLYKGGVFHSSIKDSTASDGTYNWNIPFDFQEGSDYKVLITSLDDPTLFDYSDDNFTIFLVPLITVIYPNGGEAWQTGTTQTITWADNLTENVRIRLYFFGDFITVENSVESSGSYVWDIPVNFPPNNFYKVWINSVNDTTIEDDSDAEFSIETTAINITSPNGGESWQAGTTQQITSTDNISEDVKIDLYKGGVFHSSIKDTTASDGTYNWSIPYDLQGGSDYKVKMTSLGNPDVFDFSDNNFTIIGNEVTVTSPNGGENWLLGTTEPITWADNFSENVKIELYKGGTFYSLIVNSTSSDSIRNWNIPDSLAEGSDYKIKITSLGNDNVFDFSDGDFTLLYNLTVTSPNGGEIWQTSTTQQITSTDNISDDIKIDLYKGGAFHSTIKDTTASDGTYNWSIPFDLQDGTDYKVKITSLGDTSIFDFSDSDFAIDNVLGINFISNNIPEEYILFQNYPNPFNPSTKIEFGLVEHSSVSLKLYDIIGQEVAVVIDNESLPAGMFRYDFIASNLPSGIYIYYLTVKSNVSDKTFNQPKKMILLK